MKQVRFNEYRFVVNRIDIISGKSYPVYPIKLSGIENEEEAIEQAKRILRTLKDNYTIRIEEVRWKFIGEVSHEDWAILKVNKTRFL